MSEPARQAAARAPWIEPAPSPPASSPPTPSPPAPRPEHHRAPAPTPRSRRRIHAAYLVFAGLVVSVLVVGVVALNALLAQAAFATRTAETRLDVLRREQVQLTEEAARFSSPVVVATWARHHGMVIPAAGEVHVLRVPGSGR